MTLEKCLNNNFCQNSVYAGVQGGTNCYCGFDLYVNFLTEVSDSYCNYGCSGNSGEACGSSAFISLYS